jgi:hydrogenase expression/formation protein HypE
MDPGKADHEFLAEHVLPYTGARREDVRLGPTHGADFGVLDVGDHAVALATDPVFVLRDLGIERAAWFAFHIVASDVALSGLPPSHLSVDFNLPLDADEREFAEIWRVFHREARDLGVSVVTGHTGAYANCAYPTIGAATAIAVGDPDDLVLPTGATPGDHLVVTKGPAIETVGLLATLFGDHLDLPEAVVEAGRARFWDASPVRDALTAAAAGPVSAMHDATERGLANALHELAAASDVGLRVDRAAVPVSPGVDAVCERFDIDPWVASSSGTVVLAVPPRGVDAVLDALTGEGIRAADVGVVEDGTGVELDGDPLPEPDADPLWAAYEAGVARWGVDDL